MHELGITRNIVEIVNERAEGARVSRVMLAVGELTAVIPEALHFCFDTVTQGTLLEGAELQIEQIAGRARCDRCGNEFAMPLTGAHCECGSRSYALLSGEELKIVEMELH